MAKHRRWPRVLAVIFGGVVILWGITNFLYLPLWPLSPGTQVFQPPLMEIFYPQNAGTGVQVTSNTEYIGLNIRLTFNSTLAQGVQAKMSVWGCLTSNYANGLEQIVVDFPQAQSPQGISPHLLNGGPAWGVILQPSLYGAIYCQPWIGRMYFLNETTTLLSWSQEGSYSPVMTAQYANGTRLVGTTGTQVTVQSQGSLESASQEHTLYVLGVTLPILGFAGWVFRKGKTT